MEMRLFKVTTWQVSTSNNLRKCRKLAALLLCKFLSLSWCFALKYIMILLPRFYLRDTARKKRVSKKSMREYGHLRNLSNLSKIKDVEIKCNWSRDFERKLSKNKNIDYFIGKTESVSTWKKEEREKIERERKRKWFKERTIFLRSW